MKNGVLRFLGRGSAFHTNNNSAFFTADSSLVLLDCPTSAFHKLRHRGVDTLAGCKADKVIVLVTHTHTDHVGGIGMLVHYCYYVLHLPVEIVAPNREVAEDVGYLLRRYADAFRHGRSKSYSIENAYAMHAAGVLASSHQLERSDYWGIMGIPPGASHSKNT